MRRKDGRPQNRPRRYPYGITRRNRPKPWLVRFSRNKRRITVGSFASFADACYAAALFLGNERNDSTNIA